MLQNENADEADTNFVRWKLDATIRATIYSIREEDILAACGQLHSTAKASAEYRALHQEMAWHRAVYIK